MILMILMEEKDLALIPTTLMVHERGLHMTLMDVVGLIQATQVDQGKVLLMTLTLQERVQV